jgi:hypothetical protein
MTDTDQVDAQDQTAAEIPAAAQLWDEFFQFREEFGHFLEEFADHKRRVRERHANMGQQLAAVVTVAEANTQARESFEDELIQLHIVMKQWYHSMIDLHKDVLRIAEALGTGGMASLNPPMRPPLREREHGRA